MTGQIRYLDISWALGRYDTVVMSETPYEKAAMNLVLRRADRRIVKCSLPYPKIR